MALDAIKQSTGKEIQVVLSSEEEILRTIDLYYAAKVAAESTTDRLKRAAERRDLPEDKRAEFIITEETPVVKLVNDIIVKGIKGNASDIHIEPTRDDFMVRFRIDGILRVFLNAPITLHAGVISRIKIMSGMDITEKRMPQDGRAEIKAKNRIIDLRVSTVPSIFGEKLVIRILDKKMGIMDLDQLGFYSENLQKVLNVIQHSYGMVLICGPTGSGKTSTGYSICNTTKSIQKNTVSVEDPVEYQIEGITQIQVNHDIGLTFSKV
jgi:type IV pilus assembly protein PilB